MNNDCLYCIFQLLTIDDIYSLTFVCKQFNTVANNDLLWKPLFDQKYSFQIDNKNKEGYKRCVILNHFLNKTIRKDITRAFNYVTLNLESKDLYLIPPGVGFLIQLKELDLSNNHLQSLPPEIGSLIQLQKLRLNDNELRLIPKEIGLLTQLTHLYVNSNHLQFIPIEMGFMAQLQYLHLFNNKLKSIPKEIGLLTQLKKLTLFHNKFKCVPEEIEKLPGFDPSDLYF